MYVPIYVSGKNGKTGTIDLPLALVFTYSDYFFAYDSYIALFNARRKNVYVRRVL